MFRTVSVGPNGGEVQVEYRMVDAEFIIYSVHCISRTDLYPKQGLRFALYTGDAVRLETVGGCFVDQGFGTSLKDAIMEKLKEPFN